MMKALTLWRPWPVAVFFLKPEYRKDVENRNWRLPKKYIGQRIAIHAGSKYINIFDEWLQIIKPTPDEIIDLLISWKRLSDLQGIIGTVIFSGWHYSCTSKSKWAGCDEYCWDIEDPIALPGPIQCKGAQGLWTVPTEIEEQINNPDEMRDETLS